MGDLSAYFSRSEFASKDGDPGYDVVDAKLLEYLEAIRQYFNKPLVITSGHRSPQHNADVGGAKSSLHLTGRAADFYVKDVPVIEVYSYCEHLLDGEGGLGLYDRGAGTGWIHIDSRTNGGARWVG